MSSSSSCSAPTIAANLLRQRPQWYDLDIYSSCSDCRERCAMEQLLRTSDGCHRLLQRLHASAASHADKEMLFLALRCLMDNVAQSSRHVLRLQASERAASIAHLAAVTAHEAAAAALWSLRSHASAVRSQSSVQSPLPAPIPINDTHMQFSLLDTIDSRRPHGSSAVATSCVNADANCSNTGSIFSGSARTPRHVRLRLNGGEWVQLRSNGSRNRIAIAHRHELALLASLGADEETGHGRDQDAGQGEDHNELQHQHRLVVEERSVLQVLAGRRSVLPFKVLKGDVVGFVFAVEEQASDIGFSLKKRERAHCASCNSSVLASAGKSNIDNGNTDLNLLPDLPWLGMAATPLPGAPFGSNGYRGTENAPRYGRDGSVVRGAWGPALQSCELLFCWSNRYSKMRAKTVSFTIRCWAEESDRGS